MTFVKIYTPEETKEIYISKMKKLQKKYGDMNLMELYMTLEYTQNKLESVERIFKQRSMYKKELKRNTKKLERIYNYIAEYYPELYKVLKNL